MSKSKSEATIAGAASSCTLSLNGASIGLPHCSAGFNKAPCHASHTCAGLRFRSYFTQTHAYTHNTHTHAHTHTHTHTDTDTDTDIQAQTRNHTQTHTHAHIHTHTSVRYCA